MYRSDCDFQARSLSCENGRCFVMSVCLSVRLPIRMEKLCSRWTNFIYS